MFRIRSIFRMAILPPALFGFGLMICGCATSGAYDEGRRVSEISFGAYISNRTPVIGTSSGYLTGGVITKCEWGIAEEPDGVGHSVISVTFVNGGGGLFGESPEPRFSAKSINLKAYSENGRPIAVEFKDSVYDSLSVIAKGIAKVKPTEIELVEYEWEGTLYRVRPGPVSRLIPPNKTHDEH